MSFDQVRAALETALEAVTPIIKLVHENEPYDPIIGTPYAEVELIPNQPDNSEIGPNFVEQGLMQVTLHYPNRAGPSALELQFKAIRDAFYRGRSLTAGGVTTTIQLTPALGPKISREGYVRPVTISYAAQLTA